MSDKLIALFPTTLLVTKYEADFKKEFKYIRGLEYDKQQITGSLLQSGSFFQIGDPQPTGSTLLSGSLLLTGSSALALRVTGSTALTGSLFVSGAVSSSVGFSGSFQGDGSDLTGIDGYAVANSANN